MPRDSAPLIRRSLFKSLGEGGDRPAEGIVALGQTEDGVAQSRDTDDRTVWSSVIADEVVQVAPGGRLIRDRPLQPRVPPDVLEPNSGDRVSRLRRDNLEDRADTGGGTPPSSRGLDA